MEKFKPTEGELEILDILWEDGPSTVKYINEKLNSKKVVGYTTTLKLMQIMYNKKILTREKSGRSHVYSSALPKNVSQDLIINKILESAFSGSASKLVMQAIGRKETTQKEIEEIKIYLKSIESRGDRNE